ncbi:hypothetical protein [Nesterenkonia muleiensis]|nr:hypothetical protein [Nesterenkonia muleiensis]
MSGARWSMGIIDVQIKDHPIRGLGAALHDAVLDQAQVQTALPHRRIG